MSIPDVSVCLFSYNYEKYIAEALDSILSQKTNFSVEIVVGDDFSTDRTREIVLDYKQRFPGQIVLSFNETNIGGTRNWINTINKCSGKYIALCDGDDYFIDPYKLQKQRDLLDKNPQMVLCFHSVKEIVESHPEKDKIVEFDKTVYTIEDFLRQGWFIRTSTTFFRNGIMSEQPPEWVYKYPYRYDTIIHIFLCMHGTAYNMKEAMSVWRKHEQGMSLFIFKDRIDDILKIVDLHHELDKATNYKYSGAVKSFTSDNYTGLFLTIIRTGNVAKHWKLMRRSLLRMNYKTLFSKFTNLVKR